MTNLLSRTGTAVCLPRLQIVISDNIVTEWEDNVAVSEHLNDEVEVTDESKTKGSKNLDGLESNANVVLWKRQVKGQPAPASYQVSGNNHPKGVIVIDKNPKKDEKGPSLARRKRSRLADDFDEGDIAAMTKKRQEEGFYLDFDDIGDVDYLFDVMVVF